MATIVELLEQKARIDKDIAAMKPALVQQIHEQMAAAGITLADLGGGAPAKTLRDRLATGAGSAKVPPKYRDPTSGATWSGRGLQPVWLRNVLASGKTLDSLLIR